MKTKLFLLPLLTAFAFVGCNNKGDDSTVDTSGQFISLSTYSLSFGPEGGEGSVSVLDYGNDIRWSVESQDYGGYDWCTVFVDGDKVFFTVDENTSNDSRSAIYDIASRVYTRTLTVKQTGVPRNDDGDDENNPPQPSQNQLIYYTSSDGLIVEPYSGEYAAEFPFGEGVNIVSNIYKDGEGIITFDKEITEVGNSAFYYCSNLTGITIPDSVTRIGDHAFYYCSSLESITVSNSVTGIGRSAFSYCRSLTSITIPEGTTEIGSQAFYNCKSLTSVYCQTLNPPALGANAFYGNAAGRKIYVPQEYVEAHQKAAGWNKYASDIEGYEF